MSPAPPAQQLEDCLVDGDVPGVRRDEAIKSEVDQAVMSSGNVSIRVGRPNLELMRTWFVSPYSQA